MKAAGVVAGGLRLSRVARRTSRNELGAFLGMKLRARIRLHLDTGRTLEGVLISKRGESITLADVRVEIDGALQPVDGDVYIPKHRVEFAQRGAAK